MPLSRRLSHRGGIRRLLGSFCRRPVGGAGPLGLLRTSRGLG